MDRIYLDHNATTPLHPEVIEEVRAALCTFGNPSSLHASGQEARRLIDRARLRVAALLGAAAEEIVFTSGGTEADNLAILGTVEPGAHLVVSAVEHQAVRAAAARAEELGATVTTVPVDGEGLVSADDVVDALRPETALVSVLLAQNDTGVIQPVAEISRRCRERGVAVHTDAVQAAGKIRVDVEALGVDLLSISAHKIYGPKGTGALYVRRGRRLRPQLVGGHQERRLRAGTENSLAVAGFGRAADLARAEQESRAAHDRLLRDRLEAGVRARLPESRAAGAGAERVANTLQLVFPGVDADLLLMNLDLVGVAASSGSACAEGDRDPSPTLLAMGYGAELARAGVRFSVGAGTTAAEIDRTLDALAELVPRLRRA